MFNKDYYSILGIMATAEDIVIRAAYKALAQRYHPDKYKGDPAEAQERMRDINEAYGVLSDTGKRSEYDEWYNAQQQSDEYQANDEDDELAAALRTYDEDWNTACEIFTDLKSIEERLSRVASRLALTYKIYMLESKDFQNRLEIADHMEQEFFMNYFGNDLPILKFAKELVYQGHKQAAKALNNYIRVVGSSADSLTIIGKICRDYGIVARTEKTRREEEARERKLREAAAQARNKRETKAKVISRLGRIRSCKTILSSQGYTLEEKGSGWNVEAPLGGQVEIDTLEELEQYVEEQTTKEDQSVLDGCGLFLLSLFALFLVFFIVYFFSN